MGVNVLYILLGKITVFKDDVDEGHYQIYLQGWKNSSYSPLIEFPVAKLVIEKLFENDAWYQVPRNDKENIDTNQSWW